MASDVFLSHSHADKVFADAICHRLESSGIRCWVAPRDIRPSEDWAEAIINAMDNCKILLLVFSSSSNASPQVRREVERAVNKGLSVLPFRIENVPLSKSLEYFISTQHWLDAISGDMEVHLAELRDCVLMLLGRLPPAPSFAAAQAAPRVPLRADATPPLPSGATPEPVPQVVQDLLAAALAQALGPIARTLVKRAAAPGRPAQDVVTALSLEIDDERERMRFVARCSAAFR